MMETLHKGRTVALSVLAGLVAGPPLLAGAHRRHVRLLLEPLPHLALPVGPRRVQEHHHVVDPARQVAADEPLHVGKGVLDRAGGEEHGRHVTDRRTYSHVVTTVR